MLEFWIADLISPEEGFVVPASFGAWEFRRRDDYHNVLSKVQEGQCAATYYAFNESVTVEPPSTDDEDVSKAFDDLLDICFVLSWIHGQCVMPSAATPQSDIRPIAGDFFLRTRAIRGFPKLSIAGNLQDTFSVGIDKLNAKFDVRRLRLMLSHWISGLTCYCLEDLVLALSVQMDIVKQCERAEHNDPGLTYNQGIAAATSRYSLPIMTPLFTKMRNDIVHEGKLSGTNFPNKDKRACADVAKHALDWIDRYCWAVLGFQDPPPPSRWATFALDSGLVALSLRL